MLHPLVVGRAFPVGPPCWLGKILPPHGRGVRGVKIYMVFLFFNFSNLSMGAAMHRAIPVDTAGGFAPNVDPFPPPVYPKLAQIPCEGACSLCMAHSVSPGEDEPGGMHLPSSGQMSQFLAEQAKKGHGMCSPYLDYLAVR